jgi:ribosome-associated translation inhibitor RaiA
MNIKTVGLQVLNAEQLHSVEHKLESVVEFISSKNVAFDELSVVLKEVHKTNASTHPVYEFQVNLIKGSHVFHAKSEDRDVLAGLDDAFEVIKSQVAHK